MLEHMMVRTPVRCLVLTRRNGCRLVRQLRLWVHGENFYGQSDGG
jgi:hypothetical protein